VLGCSRQGHPPTWPLLNCLGRKTAGTRSDWRSRRQHQTGADGVTRFSLIWIKANPRQNAEWAEKVLGHTQRAGPGRHPPPHPTRWSPPTRGGQGLFIFELVSRRRRDRFQDGARFASTHLVANPQHHRARLILVAARYDNRHIVFGRGLGEEGGAYLRCHLLASRGLAQTHQSEALRDRGNQTQTSPRPAYDPRPHARAWRPRAPCTVPQSSLLP
jgi:hypothetical protein